MKTELARLDKTIENIFSAICFGEGQRPNMYKLKAYFLPKGLLINYNEDLPLILPINQFVAHFEKQVEEGGLPCLEDREVKSDTKIYDRIAHRFSFYEARFRPTDEKPFAVGVNSIQLIKLENDWKVSIMAWNDDNRGDGFFNKVMGI